MRRHDDTAARPLPENLRQPRDRDESGSDQVVQNIAGSDGWKLVRIPHKNHRSAGIDRPEKSGRDQNVQHGCFVDDQQFRFQRGRAPVNELVFRWIPFQQTMDRVCGNACCFRHPFCGASGRCGKRDAELRQSGTADDLPDHRCFTHTGTAGNDGYRRIADHLYRVQLFLAENRVRLNREPHQILSIVTGNGGETRHTDRKFLLAAEKSGLIDHLGPVGSTANRGKHQPDRGIQRPFRIFRLDLKQLRALCKKLITRQTDMSEPAHLGKHIGDTGRQPLGIIFMDPHFFGDAVRHRKADSGNISSQCIGVLFDLLRRPVSVFLINF